MALSMAACGNTQSQDTPKEPEKQETVQTEGTEEGGATDVSGQQILLNLPRTLMYVFHLQQVVLQIRSQELSDRDYRRLMVNQLLSTI
ncbi:MAG: hypothetical protein BHV88_22870 [Clostridiales bacterium 41_12_two_minus]|nr:MAG: hypothetical protein BHV88_22870 [Clostridiales bacterium 41_12_two_minus]